jgi:RNA polymerase sigma factor (sigma-70 family)
VATVPAEVEGPSDAELIEAVRKGTVSAYGTLYERHVASAYNLARQLARSPAEADDLVSEAFAKVLDALRGARGPDSAFRAYLLTTLRHIAYDKTRRDRKLELSDDVSAVVSTEAVTVEFDDPAVAGLERTLAARAFACLPERWQAVLWHTEVEGQPPQEIAPLLGLTPNGVSSLAYRAREGLRQAYLQVYLADAPEQHCRAAVEKLGAWVRGGLAKREKAQVEEHLDTCERCRALAAELADVNGAMRGFVAPIVLGPAVAGYLAATGIAKMATATTAAVATGTAAAGAGWSAGAGFGGPRQFIGVAASGLALAAAIVVALTAGGGDHSPPPRPTTTTATTTTTPTTR